jgi:hypothetical protein
MEIYKRIEGFEHNYMVSNYGNVKTLGNGKSTCPLYNSERQLTKRKKSNGYFQVKLFKNGNRHHIGIHRLVALAFLPNDENKKEVNHKDCNKENNNVSNLEWCTSRENKIHASINGRLSIKKGAENKQSKKVNQYTLDNAFVQSFASAGEASRVLGISKQCVIMCCNGKIKTTSKMILKYA